MTHSALASATALRRAPVPQDDDGSAANRSRAVPATAAALVQADLFRGGDSGSHVRTPTRTPFAIDDVLGPLAVGREREAVEDLLLALLAVYLFRISGETDVAIAVRRGASPVRAAALTASEAGYVPLQICIDGDRPFTDVLQSVKAERRPMIAADGSTPAGDVQGGASWSLPLPFAVILGEDPDAGEADDAEVALVLEPGRDTGTIITGAASSGALARQVLTHLGQLSRAVAERPELPIDRLSYLTHEERRQLLVDWNATRVDYPYAGGLVAEFERQVERHGDRPAVVFQGVTLDYAAFNARVNRLARYLRQAGVGPDTFVAICLDRSAEMVIAIWAVLKAGGAYIPINVEDPPQRLSSILRNAGARIVLTDERLEKKLPKTRIKIVRLSPEDPAIADESPDNPGYPIAERDLAYMIYTSGSTGEPKGVLIEHKAIHNRIIWMQDRYRLTADDRVLQKTPYTFDVSVWEFLWPLSVGATLVVAEPGGHVVPSYLLRLIHQEAISCVHFVPSVLRLFLRCPGIEKIRLRMVFCSGEALGIDIRDDLLSRMTCELHNLYGPTEAAVDVSHFACADDRNGRRIPIGRPIANTQLYVLDEHLQPVPVGVPGELYIGGVGLARGYWARPELTEQRFVPDPFSADPGNRLYKTGDLARFLPDGNIEYLGRNDFQVKINGARIELGEIEAVIRGHSMIRDAVVIAKKSEIGNAQLFAYLVTKENGDGAASLDHLRDHLSRRLPPPMIPRAFTVLPRIPLTSSGKVDRKSLPDPRPEA
jgi:amino acid adenylation domain-containing protein